MMYGLDMGQILLIYGLRRDHECVMDKAYDGSNVGLRAVISIGSHIGNSFPTCYF